MHPKLRSILAAAGIAAAVALGAVAPAAADEVAPVAAPPEGSFVSPAHTWVDPSNLVMSIDFHFPLPTTHWVSNASAPRMIEPGTGVTSCGLDRTDFGTTLTCQATGTPSPGDKEVSLRVRSEADGDIPGVDWTFTTVATVCPLTGCSAYFELALAEPAIEVCAGDDLAELPFNSYVFNVPWNAELIEIGELDAAGDWQFISEPPANGSEFMLRGSFTEAGDYVLPIILTDEFGGKHTADLAIAVEDCSAPAPAPAAPAVLAATGQRTDHFGTMIAWAAGFTLAGLLAVAIAACATRRGSLDA